MDNFIVSARKYRPARFEDVIGQPQVTHTLKNAIRQNQLAQAFLFCGPRGVGKTTCARILAKVINCDNRTSNIEACNECPSCLSFNNNASFNVHELDAASNNSVDDMRTLIEQVRYAPQPGKRKIYIIDEVHMLSQAAFNAFLKTLEEPPPYAIFILATTEKHKIIPTILSRCQIFDFNRIKVEDMANYLATIAQREEIKAEPDALHIIAQKADGALRDALSIFDRISIFSNGHISYTDVLNNLNILDYDYFFKLTDDCLREDISTALLTLNEIFQKGFEGDNFLAGLGEHFRSLLVCKDEITLQLLETSENLKNRYSQQAKYTPQSFLLTGLTIINEGEINYRGSRNKRLSVELVLMKLCYMLSAIKVAGIETSPEAKKKEQAPEPSVKETIPTLLDKAEPYKPQPPQVKPAPVTESKPAAPAFNPASGTTKLPSLSDLKKNIAQPAQENTASKNAVVQYDTIDGGSFKVTMDKYIKELQAQQKFAVLGVLESFPPELIENKRVEIVVDNQASLNLLEEERDKLSFYLKKEMELNSIEMILRVDKTRMKMAGNHKPYTAEDKFEFLANKNPKLRELKDKLRLELDY